MDVTAAFASVIGRIRHHWRDLRCSRLPDRAFVFNSVPTGPLAKYRPMLRLFSERDREFLQHQAGYRPEIWRQLASGRRRIFAKYLALLVKEFRQLHRAGEQLCSSLSGENPSVRQLLMHERLRFARELLRLRAELLLHGLGLARPDAGPLVRSLQGLHSLLAGAGLKR
jgi:hypothetical protein